LWRSSPGLAGCISPYLTRREYLHLSHLTEAGLLCCCTSTKDLEEEKPNVVVILGLILFFIYFNDLYAASNLSKLVFADDTAGLACDKNIDNLIDNANAELNKSNALGLGPTRLPVRTKFIIFHTKSRIINNTLKYFMMITNPIKTILISLSPLVEYILTTRLIA
jgi:hypothetical protein